MGLLQAPQQHHLENRFFRRAQSLGNHLLQVQRLDVVWICLDVQAKGTAEFKKSGDPVSFRRFVHPVKERHLFSVVGFCHSFIGQKHEGFDHLFGRPPAVQDDVHRLALLIHDDLGFRFFKVDGPPGVALFIQGFMQSCHVLKHWPHLNILVFQVAVRHVSAQGLVDLVVGQTAVGPHHGRVDVVRYPLTFRGDFHVTGQNQTVNAFVQGTDPVGQSERQHWNNPVDQVGTVAPGKSFPVQRRSFFNIVGHVSDVDAQVVVAVVQLPQNDRVVKVLGVIPVDRDGWLVGDVPPACFMPLFFSYVVRDGIGLL